MQVLSKKERNILFTFFVSFLAEALPIRKKKSSFNNKLTLNYDQVLWHFFRFLWENVK